jgi:hypothetical protein
VGDSFHDVGFRAVKRGRNICVIMDQSEVYGHEDHWMDGSESMTNDTEDTSDDYCIDGTEEDGKCNGHNSNGDKDSLNKW